MGFLLSLIVPIVPIAALWAIVRYGPIPSRWRRYEHPVGFALFVGAIAFVIGFIGPMIVTPESNQGPLLGIFITGPAGLVVGLVWGALRRRGSSSRRSGDKRAALETLRLLPGRRGRKLR